MARSALIYDAHPYVADETDVCGDTDHPDHGQGQNHLKCSECGSGEGAFIHSQEAKDTAYTLAVAVDDNVSTGEVVPDPPAVAPEPAPEAPAEPAV